MSILITGAAGFIGSHLAEELLNRGQKIIAIDNFNSFYNPLLKERNIEKVRENPDFLLHKIDITDKAALEKVVSQHKIETIVHLAAKAGVRPSIIDPIGYYQTNVHGTLNLLALSHEYKINKFVFASSSSVYGNNDKVPFAETDPVDHPISPYAATKKAGELLCHTYHHLYDINIFALRFFTVYGPRQRPDLAIHKFFRMIYNQEAIPIFGDGTTSRDYTFIDDIIKGVLAGIDNVKGYEIINLGGSQPIALKDLVDQIKVVSAKNVEMKYLPMQPGDVIKTYADISKAGDLLDYRPDTSIGDGLKVFKKWFDQNLDLTLKT